MKNQKVNNGFTLAEILITLGIIGVVAALVIPPLIVNVQEKELVTRRAKAQNVLENGIKLMMAKESVTKLSDLALISDCSDFACLSKENKKVFNIVLDTNDATKYMEFVGGHLPPIYSNPDKKTNAFTWYSAGRYYIWMTSDGIVYGIDAPSITKSDSDTGMHVYVDVNADRNPNVIAKDMVEYNVDKTGKVTDITDTMIKVCNYDDPSGCTQQQCGQFGAIACYRGECTTKQNGMISEVSCTMDYCIWHVFKDGVCQEEYRSM